MAFFTGKVALVTGGSSGIGRATAVAFARQGAKVVVASRRVAEGEETIGLVKAAGSEGFFIKTDVTNEADIKTMVEKTITAYDRLDYACNSAGMEQQPTPITEQTEETFDQIVNINFKGIWLSMKHQISQMLQNGGGAIVNISSAAAIRPIPGIHLYNASKEAVLGLTKSVALDYAKSGIRVNAICPGGVKTEMFERFTKDNPQAADAIIQMHPMGRVGESEEIADGVVWLCSDQASFVTGQILAIDGGFILQ
ncbi:SDR family oxidoreductase [Fischerella sp. PCC 9605]|uniref:SDR family oxidoreductase n=1 Tax=Fischerella sp. PCC 9605 TaxID=1173024 RepID=UPI000479E4FB|nr:SDR family oxidoreductase [Fischerella sp. PCC 9605]